MPYEASPTRGAPLGRAIGANGPDATVAGVVLVLLPRARLALPSPGPLRALTRALARATPTGEDALATHAVRGGAGPALEAAVARYGDVPVCLVGHGTRAREALREAGHPAVNSVVALAPWLTALEEAASPEPVKHLAGRQVLIAHGTDDARADPDLSFRLAARAKKVNRTTCRFEVHSDGHALREHRAEVVALTQDFARGALLGTPWSRPVTDALAAPPPLGLRMPLASGYTLRTP
ncbi:alpha/beta hydrolase [Streptomyces sp. BI20]|uniref:alpha/beta hydrolase n=1 Tax=Streptomyces sp. BI20 TaxID=3403460 RepID=UPI003C77AE95